MISAQTTTVAGQVGTAITGVSVNTASFSPQINSAVRIFPPRVEHDKGGYLPPAGPGGSMFSESRSSTTPVRLLGPFFSGMGYTGAEPPDPDIAVSDKHIVQGVNTSIAFFDRNGTKLFQQTTQDFFQPVTTLSFHSDTKVIYDQIAKRFIFIVLGLDFNNSKSAILMAVSPVGTPLGTWKQFEIDVKQTSGSNNWWLDYPGLGYNKDLVTLSGNMFGFANGDGYNGIQIVGLPKAQLYSGTVTPTKFKTNGGTCQFAKTYDATTNYVYGLDTDTRSTVRLTALGLSGSTVSMSQFSVPVPTWEYAEDETTLADGKGVDNIADGRIFNACSRLGRVLGGHVAGATGQGTLASIRWYDFKTNTWPTAGTPTLNQSGSLIAPAGDAYTFPALCIDKRGNIAATFSKLGKSTPGDVMVCGRKASDPPGVMGAPIVLEKAKSSVNGDFTSRWGDYFDLELDPVDESKFWAVGMGPGADTRWTTYVKTFAVALPDALLDKTLPSAVSVSGGKLASGDRPSLFSDDTNNFVVRSEAVRGLGQVGGINVLLTMPYTNIDTMRLTYSASGQAGASAALYAMNVTTGQYEQIDSMGLSTARTTRTLDLSATQIAKFVSTTGGVNLVIRGTLPVRAGRMPGVFALGFDVVNILSLQKAPVP